MHIKYFTVKVSLRPARGYIILILKKNIIVDFLREREILMLRIAVVCSALGQLSDRNVRLTVRCVH